MRYMKYPDRMSGWFYHNGSGMHLFGFSPHEKDWGTRILITPLFRLFSWLDDMKWKAFWRWHPEHQYNIVKTALEPGYYDIDTLMLEANFALLKRYVVDEAGGPERLDAWTQELRTPDPNAPEGFGDRQIVSQSEALELWHWWTIERPADQRRDEELVDQLYGENGLSRMRSVATDNPKLMKLEFSDTDAELAEAIKLREELWALQDKIHTDEQAMLHRLIDIRPSLWT